MKRILLLLALSSQLSALARADNLGSWNIGELLTFTANTHATSGAATDADSPPSYRVYEDETGTAIVTDSMAKLDDANTTGFYSEQLTLSSANGFEIGKSYTIYISAAVANVTGTTSHNFQIVRPAGAIRSGEFVDEVTPAQTILLATGNGQDSIDGAVIVFTVHSDVGQKIVRTILSHDAGEVTLDVAPNATMQAGDEWAIYPASPEVSRAVPNVAPGSSGAIPTVGSGTAQLNVTGGAVRIVDGTGAGEIDTASGKVALSLDEHAAIAAADKMVMASNSLPSQAGATAGWTLIGAMNATAPENFIGQMFSWTDQTMGNKFTALITNAQTAGAGVEIKIVGASADPQAGDEFSIIRVPRQLPNTEAGTIGGLPTVDANNAVKVQSGVGENQISLSGGKVALTAAEHTAIGAESGLIYETTVGAMETQFNLILAAATNYDLTGALCVIGDASNPGTYATVTVASQDGAELVVIDRLPGFEIGIGDTLQFFRGSPAIHDIKYKTDFLPTVTAGSTGGLFIAGSNAATTVDITGNLSGSVGSVTGSVGSISGVTFPDNFSGLTITSGRVNADVTHWLTTPVVTPTVEGVPEVDITHVLGSPVCD